jgi:predicted amidohydrolase YtcJ
MGMRFRCALLTCALGAGQALAAPADLLITNARVWTVDAQQPWAEAVAIRGDRIDWVGKRADTAAHTGPDTKVVDAAGRLLLPGFVDCHFHALLGSNPDVLRIDADDLPGIRAQIEAFAKARPELPWIEAEGWNYSAFPGGTLPTAADLDGLAGGRPMFLTAYDYHTVWMNRAGLQRFGINRQTTGVSFAEEVQKDAEGEPTGILIGFGSAGLSAQAEGELRAHLPSHAPEAIARAVRDNVAAAVRSGITTVVEPQSDPEDVELYQRLRANGELPARMQVALFHRRGATDADLARFVQIRERFADDRLRVSAIKLYIDDVIEPHTAAMLAPYSDRPLESGNLLYPPAEFSNVLTRIDKLGFQVFIHSIGDRGVRTSLDALAAVQRNNGLRDSRHQLVHVEAISPQDIPRFRELGVTACMQPRHSAPDITGQWARAVGPERSQYAWALRSLRDAGAPLAFASDWNVAEMEPVIGIYTAMTRKGLDGEPAAGWIPAQAIDLETAIRGYTLGSAEANFLEKDRGSVTAGKYADLVLLSEDLFRIPPSRIKDVRAVMTLVGGAVVHAE